MTDYVWDGRSQRYRDKSTGRYLKQETILNLVENTINNKTNLALSYFQDLTQGKITLKEYQVKMAETIKTLHTQQYLLGAGGFKNTNSSDYLAIARDLKNVHYPALKEFAQDLQAGNLTMAQAQNRVMGFTKASYSNYQRGLKASAIANGLSWGRRYLTIAQHCSDCPFYAGLGAVPISQLILPGQQCECVYNCRCYVRYFKSREEAMRG